jgi:hypothetical protein
LAGLLQETCAAAALLLLRWRQQTFVASVSVQDAMRYHQAPELLLLLLHCAPASIVV